MKNEIQKYVLKGSIDTLSVRSRDPLTKATKYKSCADITTSPGGDIYWVRVNANNHKGKNNPDGQIYNFGEFNEIFKNIMMEIEANRPEIIRCDFAADSTDPDFYTRFYKLNFFLIQCFRVAYKTKRDKSFLSYGFDMKRRSIDVKTDDFQLTFYNKSIESGRRDHACARLEIRSLRMDGNDLEDEFFRRWETRFKKALRSVEKAQQVMNDDLERLYHQQENSDIKEFATFDEFLRRYQDGIFTRKQFVNLVMRIKGVDKTTAENKARNFKYANGILFYTKSDIQSVLDAIRETIYNYFEGDEEQLIQDTKVFS